MLLASTLSIVLLLVAQDPVTPVEQSDEKAGATPPIIELPADKPTPARTLPTRPKRLPGMGLIRIKPKTPANGPVATAPKTRPGEKALEAMPQPSAHETPKASDEKQDVPKSPFSGGKSPFGTKKEDPFAKLVRGVLPQGTSPGAIALWQSLLKASIDQPTLDATKTGPIESADLNFQVVIRDGQGSNNEADSRIRFLAPNYVRFQLEEGVELGCGPVDKNDHGFWSLSNGKEFQDISLRQYAQSKQRVLDVLNKMKNFLALAEPGNLRILSLSTIASAPINQPPGAAKHLKGLNWLTLDSPDFDLRASISVTADLKPRVYRAYLGLAKTDHRVKEAMVVEVIDGAPIVETSVWLTLGDHIGLDGVTFPGSILIRRPDFRPSPWSFTKRPTEELYLMGGSLRANLTPEDFRGR